MSPQARNNAPADTVDMGAPRSPVNPFRAVLVGLFKMFSSHCAGLVADPPEASCCSAVGTEVSTCWTPPVAADVLADWATAALWALSPAGLVVCGGALNGVNVAAAAELLA